MAGPFGNLDLTLDVPRQSAAGSPPRGPAGPSPRDEFRAILQSLPRNTRVDKTMLVDLMKVAQSNYQQKLKNQQSGINAQTARPYNEQQVAESGLRQQILGSRAQGAEYDVLRSAARARMATNDLDFQPTKQREWQEGQDNIQAGQVFRNQRAQDQVRFGRELHPYALDRAELGVDRADIAVDQAQQNLDQDAQLHPLAVRRAIAMTTGAEDKVGFGRDAAARAGQKHGWAGEKHRVGMEQGRERHEFDIQGKGLRNQGLRDQNTFRVAGEERAMEKHGWAADQAEANLGLIGDKRSTEQKRAGAIVPKVTGGNNLGGKGGKAPPSEDQEVQRAVKEWRDSGEASSLVPSDANAEGDWTAYIAREKQVADFARQQARLRAQQEQGDPMEEIRKMREEQARDEEELRRLEGGGA